MENQETENDALRKKMVKSQIVARGIRDERVIDAMSKVPRELLIDEETLRYAFDDGPLSIGFGQTISQPYIVAYMTEQLGLTGNERVLEIGTGSGYQTAVLAELASEVYTIEIIDELSRRARKRLEELNYQNIHFCSGDGSSGWVEEAPFDAIILTAAPDFVPGEIAFQLTANGRMVVPAGSFSQVLHRITRMGDEFVDEVLIAVRFVPMTGKIRERGR